MKRNDEIKIGLECCEKYMSGAPEEECCHMCNYVHNCAELIIDALAYIQQLEQENERLLNSYDTALCEGADLAAMLPNWISVEERLPRCGQYVLCWYSDIDGDKWHTVGKVMDDGRWAVDIYEIDEPEYYNVTHWMPLPEPPKGE